ncbi:C40 family peptidase [Mucilaginibacter panaciglaebae]|uniref:NlpC/P60 domain-containing protein n=1 Tax=Mucilaginibacter panaciglaebae TaxID=502331 RepID=A0ABP7WR96_9SPHI
MRFTSIYCIFFLAIVACGHSHEADVIGTDLTPKTYEQEHITHINTGNTTPDELVTFACSLEGTPYLYGSIDPEKGFDCSGFVTYVFNHFGIAVPRTSADFTPVQHPIDLKDAKRGDLILFTGTDSTQKVVGHMGIISSLPGEKLAFIHSTSGKAYGVTETSYYDSYYNTRYVKTIRIFKQNDEDHKY